MSMKNSVTPSGIEPATFRFVAQHLNHCATAVPRWWAHGCPKHVENRFKHTRNKLCVRLVIYKDHSRMHGQQNITNIKIKWHSRSCFVHLLFPPSVFSSDILVRTLTRLQAGRPRIRGSIFSMIKAFLCGDAVCWGTTFQASRSRFQFPMGSLEFFVDLILPSPLWPWNRLIL